MLRALLLTSIVVGVIALPASAAVPIQTIVTYNASAGEQPEGLALDRRGNIYVGLFGTGEIRRIAPHEQHRRLKAPPAVVGGGTMRAA